MLTSSVNNVADALSRYIGTIEDTNIDQYEEAGRCHDNTLNDPIRVAQRTDTFCKPIIYYLESGDPNTLPKLPVPLLEFDLNDGLLVRNTYITTRDGPNRAVTQLIIPESLVPAILTRIHSSPHAGHPGKNWTLLQARMLYYWTTMRLDIIKYIDACTTCAENYGSVSRPGPIQSYSIPNDPWDTVAIDLLTLPLTTDGHKYLLVAIDHFSRFSILVPLKDKQATSVARALILRFSCRTIELSLITKF